MIYDKPSLTFDEQAELLLSRGLIAEKSELIDLLRVVNYYRFSGYLYTFRDFRFETGFFLSNTKLTDVLKIYEFDKELRFLLFEGLKRIEICFKTKLAYHFSQKYGAFGYIEKDNFPNISKKQHADFLRESSNQTRRSKEYFVKRFFDKYGDSHYVLPIWMLVEILSFGTVGHVFEGLENSLKKEISACFEVEHGVLISWIKCLCYIRNLCAHHSRVWNRVLAIKPKIPKKRKTDEWKDVKNNKIFCVILIIISMLKSLNLSEDWVEKVGRLFEENEEMLKKMGFPEKWKIYFR